MDDLSPRIGFHEQKIEQPATDDLSKPIPPTNIHPTNPKSSVESSLPELRREYVTATKEYKTSLNKLLQLYETNIRKAEEKLVLARKLYSEGLIHVSQLEEAKRAVVAERNKAKETRGK